MSAKIINFLFIFFSVLYFLIFMHIPVATQELKLPGWALPSNLITLIYASIVIFLGLINITLTKSVTKSLTSWAMTAAFILMLVPALFHAIRDNNIFIDPLFAIAGGGLIFFALLQFSLSNETRRNLLKLIAFSGIIEAILAIISQCGVDIQNRNFAFGTFTSLSLLNTYVCISYAIMLYLFTNSSINKIYKTLINIVVFLIVTTLAYLSQSMIAIGLIVVIHLIYCVLYLVYSPLKKLSYTFLLLIGIVYSLYLGAYFISDCSIYDRELPVTLDNLSYICSSEEHNNLTLKAAINSFKENLFLGKGFGTFERTLLDAQIDNNITALTFNPQGYNIIFVAISEAGVFGICSLLVILLTLIRLCVRTHRSLFNSISLITIFLPILVIATNENPFPNNFNYILLLSIIAYFCCTHDNTNLPQSSTRSTTVPMVCATIILVGGITYAITAIISLKNYHTLTNENLSYYQIQKQLLNPYVNFKQTRENIDLETLKQALNANIPLLLLEATETLEQDAKYSTTPEIYRVLKEAYEQLNNWQNAKQFADPTKLDFAKKVEYYDKRFKLLQGSSKQSNKKL